MAYEMMYFQKEATSQILSPQISFAMDIYASYADSFDLSLLKNTTTTPTTTEESTNINRKSQNSMAVASQMSPEYIPATIFPDSMQSLKKSLAWNMNTSQSNNSQQQDCVAMEEDPPMFSAQNIHNFKQNFYSCPLPSPPQETTVSSSTSSIASPPAYTQHLFNSHMHIKQEHIILPPSPPESDAAFESDADIVKNEPTDTTTTTSQSTTEPPTCIDIEYFLKSSFDSMNQSTSNSNNNSISDNDSDKKQQEQQDHQLLRECLQDTSFQKKHNLRPVALESLFSGCGWNLRGDIEPVISLALEQAKCDIKATCAALDISPDPKEWTTEQAHLWLRSTIQQFKLPPIPNMEKIFPEDGQELSQLSEDEFVERCPQAGSTLHGQLEVWIAACADISFTPTTIDSLSESMSTVENPSDICMTTVIKSEIDETSIASPLSTVSCNSVSTTAQSSSTSTTTTTTQTTSSTTVTKTPTRQGSAHIHLWQFLKELLSAPQTYGTALRWIDRKQGIFKIEDSVRVARLWGRRKNRPAMNYDKLSRSIRQYYKKGIMKKTERSQRLVYQFCHPYFL